jgi:prepilin-type N-terminal cleavage/methylation domain-containing protein
VLIAIHQLLKDESGLTLVELLIVMLVGTILAALAIPAFADQTSKAQDARAKETAHTALVAIESCRLESLLGRYEYCDEEVLRALEPTLPGKPTLKVNNLGAATYTIVVQSDPSSQKFKVKRTAKGVLSFPCEKEGTAGCPAGGDWGG